MLVGLYLQQSLLVLKVLLPLLILMLLVLQGDILLEAMHLEQKILHGHYTRILWRGFLHAWNQLLLREDLCRFGNSTLHGRMFDYRRLPLSFFAV